MDDATRKKVVARARRITGQLQGVARMVEQDRYCVDILLQLASARAAVAQASKLVLRAHVESCVRDALATGQPRERRQKLDELLEVFSRHGCPGR